MSAKPVASFLHLSDMHLGINFMDAGGPQRKAVRGVIEQKAFLMQSHNPQILLMLPLEVWRLARLDETRYILAWKEQCKKKPFFDRIIVSGDISTDATNNERFQFAFEYLTSEVKALNSGIYAEQSLVGLKLPKERLLCVPGNHDKMRETSLDRYYSGFTEAPARCNYVRWIRRHGKIMVFFGMDSNAYNEGNVAVGEMDAGRLAWLSSTLRQLENEGMKIGDDFLTTEEFEKSYRFLILHHHPVSLQPMMSGIGRYVKGASQLFGAGSFTVLEGSKNLLDLIKGRIDVIFHGHEHFPVCFTHEDSGIVVVSAGTTSEWNHEPYRNSFHVVTLMSDDFLEIEEHEWNGTKFRIKTEEPYRFELKRLKIAA